MAKAWTLAKSLETLRRQLDLKYPLRSRREDGTVGDTSHQATKSDHNPNSKGLVNAFDITNDPKNGVDCEKLRQALFITQDRRVKEVIWNKMKKDKGKWNWRLYKGVSPHDKHLHISVTDLNGEDPLEWDLKDL
jgi:hypothetical protein